MKNHKLITNLFFVLLALISSLNVVGQSRIDNINEYNNLVQLYADSIKYYQQLQKMNKIDEISYQNKIYELNDLISSNIYLSNSIIQITIDSIYEANNPAENITQPESNPDVNTSVETSSELPNMDEMPPMPKQKKINPLAVVGKVMGMNTGKKSKLGINSGWYFNNWIVQDIHNPPTINMFRSFTLVGDFSLIWRRQLGKEQSRWYLNYGLGLDSRKFVQTDDFLRLGYPFNTVDSVQIPGALDKIKLRTQYIKIPLTMEYKFSKKLQVSLGAYAGYKVKESKSYYYTKDDHCIKQKYSNLGEFNDWNYGLNLGIGKRNRMISLNYDLSELFHSDVNYVPVNAWRIGYMARL